MSNTQPHSNQQPPPQVIYVQAPKQTHGFPALLSFFFPGLGQLIQGRLLATIGFFVLSAGSIALGIATAGIGFILTFLIWIWCISDAYRNGGK